ncbi:putative hydrolase or acyltransferase of alpha/beta superfamily [Herbaspirillum sp. CF444]|nr:putative hydrolase or acyltransferase of alpha/beta superfamily [Herbaspirillum sp. CF444]
MTQQQKTIVVTRSSQGARSGVIQAFLARSCNILDALVSPIMFNTFKHAVCASLFAVTALTVAVPASAQPIPYPASFKTDMINVDGVKFYVRVGGRGPAVVLIHGFGDTGDMWTPLAVALAKGHRVVVPDLRGMGLSSKPEGGYDKKTQASDIRAILDKLGIDKADIVSHDIGTMVAYAYAASYPDKTAKLVVMDGPVPGIPPWEQIVRLPVLWHFDFGGKDVLRLVQGRERIYLDRFWNDFAGNPAKLDEGTRTHYAKLYARPGAMKAGFAQFQSIRKDTVDNAEFVKTKLTMPVLAVGGEKSFGASQAEQMRNAATNVTEVIIPDAGHWLMEEAPAATVKAVQSFLDPN